MSEDTSPDTATDTPPKMTREQIAVASYETFMAMMTMLQTRLDHSAAKNYVSITMDGLVAPFDRVLITFVRPGGRTPVEIGDECRRVATLALDLLSAQIEPEDETMRDCIRGLRARLPPPVTTDLLDR